jgi:anti-sigma regulatory factor (Ser/Thr protein kinase)
LEVFPWLAKRLQVSTASLAEFKTCIREIFNNIEDHSTERIGCAHIQWFPNEQRIRMSVSDFGIGIPSEIRRVYPDKDDGEAIALAIQEGISSKRGGRNRGAGLSYLVDNVVRRNQGQLRIFSNHGQLTCSPTEHSVETNTRLSPGYYPGTLISILLRTDRIEPVEEDRESLEW